MKVELTPQSCSLTLHMCRALLQNYTQPGARDPAQVVQGLPSVHKALDLVSMPHKTGVVAHTYL